ncbi:MAG: glycine--tRNA ligase subunit beta [Candidatus Brocadiia bacterium]|jgi:glycyl-tRNA synthetase beta chain
MADLLYEIGAEEIPAGYIEPALEQLARALARELDAARLSHGPVTVAGTPRRLVVAAANVAERQADSEEEAIGPSVKAAFDAQGKPTRAAEGFARSQGIAVTEILRKETPRGLYCAARKRVKGRSAAEILAEALPKITLEISFPKSMVWLSGQRGFARPIRSLLALLGTEVVPFTLFEVASGRTTEGHPILCPGRVEVPDADFERYKKLLREHLVVVDIAERTDMIFKGIQTALRKIGGFSNNAALSEVTNLVQWPSVATCNFDPVFLKVPAPAVEAAMIEHQRYFPVRDAAGALLPHFLVVSDRGPEHEALIRAGNERVLRARLADAQFFDQQDRKVRLADRVEALRGVAFLKGLGNYFDKTQRLEQLTKSVAEHLGLDDRDAAFAVRAARLCKADLLTEMVGEFPALQGEVGRVYALRDGEPPEVAAAIAEHYMPRSADGELPASMAGRALSVAEKLDNLASCFAAGLIPSGSADPYALRRQSQGILRIVETGRRHFKVSSLVRDALKGLPEPHCRADAAVPKAMEFLQDRLVQMALDRGAPHDLIRAALAPGFEDICDFWLRLDALRGLSAEPCWPGLVTAVERTYNISKALPADVEVAPALFSEPLEKDLWSRFETHRAEIERLQAERDYAKAGRRYAEVFAAPLHEFFEKVFVNVEDADVRANRLLLLRRINRLFSAKFADLAQIVTGVQK